MYRLLYSCILLLAACGNAVPERPSPASDSSQNATVPEDVVPEHLKPGYDTVDAGRGR